MRNPINLSALVKPRIILQALDANGVELWRREATNTLTYAAADILNNALTRSGPAQVTHLYARFGGELANQGWLSPEGGDLKATTRNTFLSVNPGETVIGGLWVPVLSAPAKSSTDQDFYAANQASFYFRIPFNISNSQVEPDNFKATGAADDSFIYALGLAVAADNENRSFDVVITASQAIGWDPLNPSAGSFTAFNIPTGGQMAITYHLPFSVR